MALTSAVILLGLGLTACGNKSNSSNSKTDGITNSQNQQSMQTRVIKEKFAKIKLGDAAKKGEGGDTDAKVTEMLGKGKSTPSRKIAGNKTTALSWNEGKIHITVYFIKHHAVSKYMMRGLVHTNKLTLKAYKAVEKGSSYNDLVKKFGEPCDVNQLLSRGTLVTFAGYYANVPGKTGANATFIFNDDQLVTKAQTDLK